jgi:hypothetical protein
MKTTYTPFTSNPCGEISLGAYQPTVLTYVCFGSCGECPECIKRLKLARKTILDELLDD